jgi:hypothetical protein
VTTITEGEPVEVVAVEPYGLPAILTPDDWKTLKRLKLDTLRFIRGHVYACGGRSRAMAARVLTGTSHDNTKVIR